MYYGSIGIHSMQDSSHMVPPIKLLPTKIPHDLDSSQRAPPEMGFSP